MNITIAERLRPFSHTPGTKCLLPGSTLFIEVFPTLIRVFQEASIQEVSLELKGPVKEFTTQLDLEKGCIWVWGHYQEGYRRFRLWADKGQFKMALIRGGAKETHPYPPIPTSERLSLGSHKKQDWDLVKRRADLKEILPHWIRLGQLVSIKEERFSVDGLLERCRKLIEKKDKVDVYQAFINLFHVHFEGILVPRWNDPLHQGLSTEQSAGSPLLLLTEGAKLIRRLFVEEGETIEILPMLPPAFHTGRFIGIELKEIGTLDLEWSKKRIRRMVLRSLKSHSLSFVFQTEVKHFRLRKGMKDKGTTISVGEPIVSEGGATYFFDNFRK